MKFAHIADCHIGSWRDPKLKDISGRAFIKAIGLSISKNVDFILISGDLFNTSIPGIDNLKVVVSKLKQLKEMDIPVYIIAGSHDFSPSGKTMIDVLEEAGLLVNVVKGEVAENKLKLKFTLDKKTGAKIAGMLGRKGQLEKKYYEDISRENLENERGYKIFMFHSAISELKPKDLEQMESQPISLLPRGFNYYAGGHIHIVKDATIQGYGTIVYPGPLFPNNFREIEQLKNGGFYIFDDGKLTYEPIVIYNVESIKVDCTNKTPELVVKELTEKTKNKEFFNTIVTIRLEGVLESGKPSDIDFKDIFSKLYNKSAYFVMKNTNALMAKEFENIQLKADSAADIEETLIKEHLGQISIKGYDEKELVKDLISAMSKEKEEGERTADFESRLLKDASKIMDIEEL